MFSLLMSLNDVMEKPLNMNSSFNETINLIFNRSQSIDNPDDLLKKFENNRKIDSPTRDLLVAFYSILMLIGAIGNILVVTAVVRKPLMRTARNMFIVNLAVSDTLVCILGTPLTLMELLTKYWPLPNWPSLCKACGALQAISIFVSTISITAIALDRYQVVQDSETLRNPSKKRTNAPRSSTRSTSVDPMRPGFKIIHLRISILLIWIGAIAFASPFFIYKTLTVYEVVGFKNITFCSEDWPYLLNVNTSVIYSICTLIFQYIMPALVVVITHFKIYKNLKIWQRNTNNRNSLKKTRIFLIIVVVTNLITWLPLNIINLLIDIKDDKLFADEEKHALVFAVCHILGLTSAVFNPILYGLFNPNFKREFKDIFDRILKTCHLCYGRKENKKGIEVEMSKLTLLAPTVTLSSPQANNSEVALLQ